MKLLGQVLATYLLLANFNLPRFSKAQSNLPFCNACSGIQVNSTSEMDMIVSNCENHAENSSIILNHHLAIMKNTDSLKNLNLVLIIADNAVDAVALAKFLSQREKMPPYEKRNYLKNNKALVHNFMLTNFQAFENPDISTIFLAHPHYTNNDKSLNQMVLEIMKMAKNAKIILTLPNPSLGPDTEKSREKREHRIYWLFETAAEIIRNVEKYKQSSFLVVTNGTYDGNNQDSESDLNMDEKIEQDYRNLIDKYAQNSEASNQGKLLAKYMVDDKENVIFAGGMTTNELKKIIEHIQNDVKYRIGNIPEIDFRMNVFFKCIFASANEQITSDMHELISTMKYFLLSEKTQSNMKTLSGVLALTEKLDYAYESLSSFLDCMLKQDTNLRISCFNKLVEELQHLQISNIVSKSYNFFSMLCMQACPFDENMNSIHSYISKTWTFVLKEYLQGVLKDEKDWYNKLKETYDNVDSLSSMEITVSLEKLSKELTSHAAKYQNSDAMQQAYNTVKLNTVKTQANYSCLSTESGLKLQVTGTFLRLGKILNTQHCKENFKILEIFALEKIIIDQDLIAVGKELNVFIFSPVWEIISKRNIVLDGVSRNLTMEDHLDPKARNGNQITNRNGEHGLAGLAGGPAGTFYGIADTIINEENLKISLNGGNGSNGQNGGDGADGEDGETPAESYLSSNANNLGCVWLEGTNSPFKIEASSTKREFILSTRPYLTQFYSEECYIFGVEGFPGGNGGNGGLNGKGSKSGDLKLFSLNDSVEFSVVLLASNGTDGKSGLGGKRGMGGYTRKITWRTNDMDTHSSIKANVPTTIRASEGMDGKDNTSLIGSKMERDAIVSQSFAQTVNLYKRFILSNIKSQDSKYLDLYKKIIKNKNIHKTDDTLALVNEIIDLEQHYYEMENKSETLILYQSLGQRIKDYDLNKKESEKTNMHETVLHRLHEMVLEKIEKLKETSNNNMVFMIQQYLETCKEQFDSFKNAERVVEIKELNSDYSREYDDKIQEAQRIIQENLQREIDRSNAELKGETEMLIRQIIRKIDLERKRDGQLRDKLKLVEKKNVIQQFNAIFDIVNVGLGFINPGLAVVGSKIAAAGSTALTIAVESGNKGMTEMIPDAIEKSFQFYDHIVKAKSAAEKLVIDMNLKEIEKEKEQLNKTGQSFMPLDKLASAFFELKTSLSDNKLSHKDLIFTMYNKLVEETGIWEKMNDAKDHIYAGALKVMKKMKFLSQIKQIIGDWSAKIEKLTDNSEIEGMRGQIDATFKTTLKLRNFKEEVCADMIPMVEKIRENTDVAGKFSSSSVAFLDFQKFGMEKYFKKILTQLNTFIKEFGVKGSFEQTLKNLEEAVDMMLNTFNRIQQYIETKKKANYDAKLLLTPFDIAFVEDVDLSMALANMLQISHANIVLDSYNKLKTSLKSYTFPFAHHFIGTESTIPLVNNLLTRSKEAGERFDYYSSKLSEYQEEHVDFTRKISAKFGYNTQKPFHTWNNTMYLTEINEILSGKEVTLFANITQHTKLNAVKFSEIWLRFKFSDSSNKQDEIDMPGFDVKLTHNGDSYYRCDDKVFLISSKAYTFRNEIINEEKKSDNILSPYATWKIKLEVNDEDMSFESLKKYKSKVNVELVGIGQYTARNQKVCKSDLTQYYGKEL